MNIGLAIKTIREQKGINQKELAKLTKISPTSISLIEKSYTSPHYTSILKIANALNVTVDLIYLQGVSLEEMLTKEDKVIIKRIITQLLFAL